MPDKHNSAISQYFGRDPGEPYYFDPSGVDEDSIRDRLTDRGYQVIFDQITEIRQLMVNDEALPSNLLGSLMAFINDPLWTGAAMYYEPEFAALMDQFVEYVQRNQDLQIVDGNIDTDAEFEAAFGVDFTNGIGLLTTQDRVSELANSWVRSDITPAAIHPWECRIGAGKFFVPPISVNVSKTFQTGSLTGGSIRMGSSPKFNSGHSETMISMTLYFPTHEQIWGFDNVTGEFNFETASEEQIDKFLSSLRGLVTQFKFAPFLPIRNDYLNRVYGINGVVMQSMSVSTVEEFPFCLAVNLQLLKFNHKVYLPMIDDFHQAIHWGRYRQYMGRAALKIANDIGEGFLVETVDPTNAQALAAGQHVIFDPDNPNPDDLNPTASSIIYRNGRAHSYFDKEQEFRQGQNIKLFYPKKTPARIFAPDMSQFRTDREDEGGQTGMPLWKQFLGLFNVDADADPSASYDSLYNLSQNIQNGDFNDERELLWQHLLVLNLTASRLMDGREEILSTYISDRVRDFEASKGSDITDEERLALTTQVNEAWYGFIFMSWQDSPFFRAMIQAREESSGDYRIQEWEVPMEKLDLNWDDIKVNGVSVTIANNMARFQLQMQDEPTYQHIGGRDAQIEVSLTVVGEVELIKLRRVFEHINGLARLEHAHGVLGFLGIKNIITTLCGVKYVLPMAFEIDTIPNYPHMYNVRISFTDFDIFQQKREELSEKQQREFVEMFSKRNPFLRLKQIWSAFNAYPDFPLSVREEDGTLVGFLEPDYYFRAFQMIDDDIMDWRRNPEKPPTALVKDPTITPVGEGDTDLERRYVRKHTVTTTFGHGDRDMAAVQMLEMQRDGLRFGSMPVDGGPTEYVTPEPLTFNEDNPDRTLTQPWGGPQFTPAAQYQNPYMDGSADPMNQFHSMLQDTAYRDISGRMIRAFPTYMLWLIDEGGKFAGVKLFDNFYGLQSVIDFSVVSSEDVLGDTLVLRLSNLYSKLTTPFERYIIRDRDEPYDPNEPPTDASSGLAGLIDGPYDRMRNLISGTDDSFIVNIKHIRLRPGVRVHLRAGYSSNPNSLQTLFNGTIAEVQVEGDDTVTVTCQSDAIELSPTVNSANKKGDSGTIDGAYMSGLWLSEPRDLMVRLLSMGTSTFTEQIAHATNGMIFSENKFGIRHFGNMLYEPLTEADKQLQDQRTAVIQHAVTSFTGTLGTDSSGNTQDGANTPNDIASVTGETIGNPIALLYDAAIGESSTRSPVLAIMQSMWIHWINKVDYEVFKRNIYPGNGLGVAQYLGGDAGDGGLTLAVGINNVVTPSASGETRPEDLIPTTPEQPGTATTLPGSLSPMGILSALVNGQSPMLRMMGITSETEDDLRGMDEVSFRAQTYMKSVWDLFRLCAGLLPNYIVAVRPFEDRSTVFYGKPHWLYTSGVVPISTGVPNSPDIGPQLAQPDLEWENYIRQVAEDANPLADLERQNELINGLDSETAPGASGNSSTQWSGGNVDQLPLTSGAVTFTQRSGRIAHEMHLPTSSILSEDIQQHMQLDNLPDQYKHPVYMDREGGGAGGGAGFDVNNQDTGAPGHPGAFGYLDPAAEQFYFCVPPGHASGTKEERKAIKAVFRNDDPNSSGYGNHVVCQLGEVGPGDDSYLGGLSPDAWFALGADHGSQCTMGIVPSTTALGPPTGLRPSAPADSDDEGSGDGSGIGGDVGGRGGGSSATLEPRLPEWMPEGIDDEDVRGHPALYAYKYGYLASHAEIPIWWDPDSTFYEASMDATGERARGRYDEDYSETDSVIDGGGRTLEQASSIWSQFRRHFHEYGAVKEVFEEYYPIDASTTNPDALPEEPESPASGQAPVSWAYKTEIAHAGSNTELYMQVVNLFKRFMWQSAYTRAWLVITTDHSINTEINPVGTALDVAGWGLSFTGGVASSLFGSIGGDIWNTLEGATGMIIDETGNIVEDVVGGAADAAGDAWDFFSGRGGDDEEEAESEAQGDAAGTEDVRDTWDFNSAKAAFRYFLDPNGESHISIHEGGRLVLEDTLEWMRQNDSHGRDSDNILDSLMDDVHDLYDETIGHILTVLSNSVSGLINMMRLSLQQLGAGLNMVGQMQRQANILNRVFNDSIYYRAGQPNSITRAADNPFTREYGEPVVEIREPFQRLHYLNSFQHIVSNQVIETSTDVATVVTATSDGKYPVTVYFDKGASSERQVETTIDTGLFWDNATGGGFFGFLHPLFHPIESVRGIAKIQQGSSDELLSKRVALSHLKENLKDIYQGEIYIMGNPDIRTHDLVYLADVYCQPADTKVSVVTQEGTRYQEQIIEHIPIQDIKSGDKVVSMDSKGYIHQRGKAVTAVSENHFEGNLIQIETTSNKVSRYTPNHKCIVKYDNALQDKWVVYLMEKDGNYRVGLTQGMRHTTRANINEDYSERTLGIAMRMRQERANAAWILAVHDSLSEAMVHETVVSYQYRIPQTTFYAHNGPLNQSHIDSIWRQLGRNRYYAEDCLKAHGLDINLPFRIKGQSSASRRASVTYAINLIDNVQVRIEDGSWESVTVSKSSYEGPVYSLDVEDDQTYVADSVFTHNSRMYGMFEVEQVVHTMSPDTGYYTSITPNAVVTINDPARWSTVAWIRSWMSVKDVRDHLRNVMGINTNSSAPISGANVTLDDLYNSIEQQLMGHVQYTHGSSALVSDFASYSAGGLIGSDVVTADDAASSGVPGLLLTGAAGMPIIGDLIWDAWRWVRDNLLDQHGCYIQYLTKDGEPMDAGLSYNQGVAVGTHHSIELLPDLLSVPVKVFEDGHRRITSDDLLSSLGWNEIDISNVRRDLSLYINQTNANILELSGGSPDGIVFSPPGTVGIGRVISVKDGDTIEIEPLDGGESTLNIRLTGVNAPELKFKDDLSLNNPNNRGLLAQEFLHRILIEDQEALEYEPTIAFRVNENNQIDDYSRTLAVIFHNVPYGTPAEQRTDTLKKIASRFPLVEWDSYMDDGRPYTANWAIIAAGLAYTDMGGLAYDRDRGYIGLGTEVGD